MQNGIHIPYWQYSSKRGWEICDRGTLSGTCPRCGSPLHRVPRRFIDRLFNFRRHRFECVSQYCCGEGNLPIGNILP